MLTSVKPNTWRDLQDKVSNLLTDCGFHTQIEKKVKLTRGSKEIDVYAEENIDSRKYTIIIECKYWKSKINQDIIHGFRTVASDLGCNIGYIITTSNFQKGAFEAVENTNIKLLTWDEFQVIFFESWYLRYFCTSIRELHLEMDYHLVDWFDLIDKKDKSLFFDLQNTIMEIEEIKSYLTSPGLLKNIGADYSIPKLPLFNNLFDQSDYYGSIPVEILNEKAFLEFQQKFIEYGNDIYSQFIELDKKYNSL